MTYSMLLFWNNQGEKNNFLSRNKATFFETRNPVTLNKPNETQYYGLRTKYFLCQNPHGRLGNWKFEFAASLGIADTMKYKYVIKSSHNLLEYFKLKQVVRNDFENVVAIGKQQWQNAVWRNSKVYLLHNLKLKGVFFFHSLKYFENVSAELRKAFTIKPQFLTQVTEFLEANAPRVKTLVGIHVRRGDFLSKRSVKRGNVVADTFYLNNAMGFFRKKYVNVFFVVVSDDKTCCKDNIKGKNNVLFSEFREPILDMAIMSLYDHSIINGGTFGWWGG